MAHVTESRDTLLEDMCILASLQLQHIVTWWPYPIPALDDLQSAVCFQLSRICCPTLVSSTSCEFAFLKVTVFLSSPKGRSAWGLGVASESRVQKWRMGYQGAGRRRRQSKNAGKVTGCPYHCLRGHVTCISGNSLERAEMAVSISPPHHESKGWAVDMNSPVFPRLCLQGR